MEQGSNMICRYVVACSHASDDRIKKSKLKLTKNLASKHQDMHQRSPQMTCLECTYSRKVVYDEDGKIMSEDNFYKHFL